MKRNDLADAVALPPPGRVLAVVDKDDAAATVGSLYQETSVGLIRLAYVILSDQQAAEDVVQEAFCNLYRQWPRLDDPERARYYVRASVINGCRSAMRRQRVRSSRLLQQRKFADPHLRPAGRDRRHPPRKDLRLDSVVALFPGRCLVAGLSEQSWPRSSPPRPAA
jgi:DNA-directed RNA polymerase specialized sigma24 family protein